MAIVTDYRHYVYKTATNKNDSSLKHTFWKTNFNMPVEDIYESTTWVRYEGPVDRTGTDTSFDLSSFYPGYETNLFDVIFDWENTGGSGVDIDVNLYSKWVDTDDSTTLVQGANGYNYTTTIPAGSWTEYIWGVHIGVAGWEIDGDGTYYVKSEATGSHPISEHSTSITYSNVPSTSQLSSDKEGYIWVEGNYLAFVNANGWKHKMGGVAVGATGLTPGYIWIDGEILHWVGDDGKDYTRQWQVKQFASNFSNSSTGEEYAGTDKAGMMWVDDEFGSTHIAYIAEDGYKYLTGAGDNPY